MHALPYHILEFRFFFFWLVAARVVSRLPVDL